MSGFRQIWQKWGVIYAQTPQGAASGFASADTASLGVFCSTDRFIEKDRFPCQRLGKMPCIMTRLVFVGRMTKTSCLGFLTTTICVSREECRFWTACPRNTGECTALFRPFHLFPSIGEFSCTTSIYIFAKLLRTLVCFSFKYCYLWFDRSCMASCVDIGVIVG